MVAAAINVDMGLMSWLGIRPPLQVESPWAPSDVLDRITFAQLFPDIAGGCYPITRAEAMAVPAVAAARHRIVGTLSRLPLTARNAAGDDWTAALGLIRQPDDAEPHVATMTRTLDDLLFDGAAWWLVVSSYSDVSRGRPLPRSIVQVPTSYMECNGGPPRPSDAFLTWCRDTRGVTPLADPGAPGRPWLLYFTGPHGGLLDFGRSAIRAAAAMERAAGRAADNPVPSVELHQVSGAPLTNGQIDEMIARWAAGRRGENGGVAYTNAGIEARMHGAADAQLLVDGRNQSAVDIARLAGIQASAIDAAQKGSSITYANLTERVTDLVNFGLTPYAAAITSRLSMDDVLPQGVSCHFDYSTLYPVPTEPAPAGAQQPQGATP